MSKTIYIGGRLESKEKGNVVTGANAILDDTKGKKQNVINKETDDELARLEQSKQDNLNFDSTPTEDSTNPVTSGGVYTAEKALSDAIEAILLLIPSAATALNKLVDTNTMNSSISMATATFRGTYNAVSDLGLTYQATHAQIEAALDALGLTADNNDFAFVQIPVSDQSQDIAKTERFKFNGTNWLYEYDLNTSGFTAAQWAAINSGITVALVQKLAALPTNAELLQALGLKQDVLTFDNAPTMDSNNPVKSGGIKTAINTAVDNEATARENADTALSGLIGDEKTRAEGIESGLNTRLGAVEGSVSTIQGVIPSEATSSNKLVDNASMTTFIGTIIDNIDATFNVHSTDGHVTLHVTQVDGVITSVEVTTSDIASAADLTLLAGRVTSAEGNITSLTTRMSGAEIDIATLRAMYNALQQSEPDIIEPTDTWPVANPSGTVIYRVIDRVNTPPEYYSDYMWNGTSFVLMATYNNAIDDEPTAGSNNLVKSGGVLSFVYDLIEKTVDNVFAEILVDSNGSILECRDVDGKKTIFTDVEIIGELKNKFIENLIHEVSVEYQETKDFVGISQMLIDVRQKLLEYIDEQGNKTLKGGLTVEGEFYNEKVLKDIKDNTAKITQSILNSRVCISDIERFKAGCAILSSYDSTNNNLYCVYIGSSQVYGEEHVDDILLTVFPILQPWKAETVVVVETGVSYSGVVINNPDCSTICEIGNNTLRIFFTTVQRQKYFYRDYNKTTKTFGDIHVIQYNGNDLDIDVAKDYLDNAGYTTNTDQMVMHTKIVYHNGYHYGMLCFKNANPILFRSDNGCQAIEFLSIVPSKCNYESCLCFVGERLYITIREGTHFMYYTDDFTTWTPLDIIPNGSVSYQRAKLVEYKGLLYILHSVWGMGGKNQISGGGRDNVVVHSYDGNELKKLLALQDDNGIVYYDAVIVSDIMYFMFSNSDLYLNEDINTYDGKPQGKDVEYFVKLLNL